MTDPRESRPPANLSATEAAILRALADGLQSKEIAEVLNCSRASVEFSIRRLFVKFDAQSRAQLVIKAVRAGWLSL